MTAHGRDQSVKALIPPAATAAHRPAALPYRLQALSAELSHQCVCHYRACVHTREPKNQTKRCSGPDLHFQAGVRPGHQPRMGALAGEPGRGTCRKAGQLPRAGAAHRSRVLPWVKNCKGVGSQLILRQYFALLVTLTAIERPLCGPHEHDGPQCAEPREDRSKIIRCRSINTKYMINKLSFKFIVIILVYFCSSKTS